MMKKLLTFYLKNQIRRQIYGDHIIELIKKNRRFLAFYHREMGKLHSLTYRRRLREMGIKSGFFAVLEGHIVAAGRSQAEIEQIVGGLIPKEKVEYVHVFRVEC